MYWGLGFDRWGDFVRLWSCLNQILCWVLVVLARWVLLMHSVTRSGAYLGF